MGITEELERLGITPESGIGFFFLDFGAYFPYRNQEVLLLDASLSTGPKETGKVLNIRENCVLNNRYPNKHYVTMTEKFGRKLCKCGCVIPYSHGRLKEVEYLNIGYGFDGQMPIRMSIPITTDTSDEKPGVSIAVKLNLERPDEPDLRVDTLKIRNSGKGWDMFTYHTDIVQVDTITLTRGKTEGIALLTPANDEEDAKSSGFVVYAQTIELAGHRIEDIGML